MICKRCDQRIPKNSRSIANGYCKHCFKAVIDNNPDIGFMNG